MNDIDGIGPDVPRGDGPYLIAAGGWCAPSDQVYMWGTPAYEHREPECPPWEGLTEDACETRGFYDDGPSWKSWHDCKDQYSKPHTICVCEDCGAERIIIQETPRGPLAID